MHRAICSRAHFIARYALRRLKRDLYARESIVEWRCIGERRFDRPSAWSPPSTRGSPDLEVRLARISRERRKSDGAWRLSALIYGQLRTAYYRHIQLILPGLSLPPLFIVPSVRHLTLVLSNHP